MVGMLQIITYLICIYLIFKGMEILQIGLMGPPDRRSMGVVLGTIMTVIAIITATVFSYWITQQAQIINEGMRSIPRP